MKLKKRPVSMPADLKAGLIKQFRAKDGRRRFVVVGRGDAFEIHAVAKGKGTLLRRLDIPAKTEVPVPVLKTAHRELAIFTARTLARTDQLPTIQQLARRRRRLLKKAVADFQAHTQTKVVVQKLNGTAPPALVKTPLRAKMPWVFIYDPKQCLGETTFRVHSAYCTRLDQERKRAVLKRGGATWIVEAQKALGAIAMQMEEFDAEDKGYALSDFTLHECAAPRVRVTGKTSMGIVGKIKGRRGR